MPRNSQSLLRFFNKLEIALLSNSKLFFAQSQMFDKSKIYLQNLRRLFDIPSLRLNFKHLLLPYRPSTSLYDFNMMNGLEKFDWGLISLPTVYVHKDKTWQNMEKGTEKGKVNICCFYDIILSFKSI